MDWVRLTHPNSLILVVLKIIASVSFAILGLLFIFSGDINQLVEGILLVVAASAWLFFVLRSYLRHRIDLGSLR